MIGILMLATVAVLLVGMTGMLRANHDPMRSNRLMRWRVVLQGAALLLMMLFGALLRP